MKPAMKLAHPNAKLTSNLLKNNRKYVISESEVCSQKKKQDKKRFVHN